MNTVRKLILSGTVLSFAATGFAVAQGTSPAPTAPSAMEENDTMPGTPDDEAMPAAGNDRGGDARAERRNRTVSQEEFGSRQIERLSTADADGNGELSRAEIEDLVLRRMVERRANRMMKRLDVNGDGTVTLAETESQQAKRFAYLDRNEDGQLDRSEMRAGRGMGRDGGERGGHHHRGRGGGERQGPRG